MFITIWNWLFPSNSVVDHTSDHESDVDSDDEEESKDVQLADDVMSTTYSTLIETNNRIKEENQIRYERLVEIIRNLLLDIKENKIPSDQLSNYLYTADDGDKVIIIVTLDSSYPRFDEWKAYYKNQSSDAKCMDNLSAYFRTKISMMFMSSMNDNNHELLRASITLSDTFE